MDADTIISSELALDILQNGFHLPITDGIVNKENIEDQIIIAMYKKELPPVTDRQLDMAIENVQMLVEEFKNIE